LNATTTKRSGGNGISLVLDFGLSALQVLSDEQGAETAIERESNGRLTEASRAAVKETLRSFVKLHWWRPRPALCALPATGVSIRRVDLPPATAEATLRLLHLQLEQAFPVPPSELAWGYRIYGSRSRLQPDERQVNQEVAVVAVRRETLEDYAGLLAECGIRPTFTLGALAAANACPISGGAVAVLDVGRTHSEWLRLRDGRPEMVRTLAWGGETVTRSLVDALDVDRTECERLVKEAAGRTPDEVDEALEEAMRPLTRFLTEAGPPVEDQAGTGPIDKLYVTGRSTVLPDLGRRLSVALGGADCQAIPPEEGGSGRSAVNLGLRRMAERTGAIEPIHFHDPRTGRVRMDAGSWRRYAPWIATAAGLLLAMIVVRYLPPIWKAGSLERDIETTRGQLAALPPIDKELSFLAHLEEQQPPVLDALSVFALAAPDEAVLQEFTLNARGSVSMKVLIHRNEHNPLREMLTRSGWFSRIVLQNLTPAKGKFKKPRMIIELTARLTPPPDGLDGARKRLEAARSKPPTAAATGPKPPKPGTPGPKTTGPKTPGPKTPASETPAPNPAGASGSSPKPPETRSPKPAAPSPGTPVPRPTVRAVPKSGEE